MIRHERLKYIHYPGFAPELFDCEADPDELHDLGTSTGHAEIRAECEARLRALLDPDEANARAFADQRVRIEALGGEAVICTKGDFGNEWACTSPPEVHATR